MRNLMIAIASLAVLVFAGAANAWHADGVYVKAKCNADEGRFHVFTKIKQSEQWPNAFVKYTSPSSFPGDTVGTQTVKVKIGWTTGETQTFRKQLYLNGDCEPLEAPPEPEPVPEPIAPPQVSAVGFCVQTSNFGWTYVHAYAGAFDAGREWRNLYDSSTSVLVAGRVVKFINEGENGIMLAPFVAGVGETCDQPYVSSSTPAVVRFTL